MLPEKKTSIEQVLSEIRQPNQHIVSYDDWLKIDKVEKERGQERGKSREKILSKEEMISLVKS